MKLEGRILLFDMVNINNDIFPKTCKMDISEKIPLTWDFQHDKVIGFANVIKDERGLIAKAETFSNEFIGVKDIKDVLTNGKIGAGGFYNKVKKHNEGKLIIIDEAALREVALVLEPVREEYLLKIVEDEE